jgi:hypothetical protein
MDKDIDQQYPICYNSCMDKDIELYCTQDDDGTWLVWFPHPLGEMNVLETFNNETQARAFWQEQIDSADFGDEE